MHGLDAVSLLDKIIIINFLDRLAMPLLSPRSFWNALFCPSHLRQRAPILYRFFFSYILHAKNAFLTPFSFQQEAYFIILFSLVKKILNFIEKYRGFATFLLGFSRTRVTHAISRSRSRTDLGVPVLWHGFGLFLARKKAAMASFKPKRLS